MLSDKAKLYLKAGLASNEVGQEVADTIDALVTSLNALLDELEARRDATESVSDSVDGTYEDLKV